MAGSKPVNLAVLLSGGGTTLQNLLDHIGDGRLNARVQVVISSRRGAGGLERARRHGVKTVVCASRDYPDFEEMSLDIWRHVEQHPVDLVCLAGFMCFLRIKQAFLGRVINIHPSLIPAFCGKGLYGHRVHEEVIKSGVKVTGCTVHFADNEHE